MSDTTAAAGSQPRPMRRERRRAETIRDIKSLALAQLADVGASGLNLRAIARDLEMSSAGIYRYYASRDDLLITLIVDGFESLGDGLRAATDGVNEEPERALVAALDGYRRWARESPQLFSLLFTDPVPGFAAPVEGPTTAAVRAALTPVTVAVAGVIDPSWAPTITTTGDGPVRYPPDVLVGLIRVFSVVHGFVSLEVFHHLDWAGADLDAEFDRMVRELVDSLRPVS